MKNIIVALYPGSLRGPHLHLCGDCGLPSDPLWIPPAEGRVDKAQCSVWAEAHDKKHHPCRPDYISDRVLVTVLVRVTSGCRWELGDGTLMGFRATGFCIFTGMLHRCPGGQHEESPGGFECVRVSQLAGRFVARNLCAAPRPLRTQYT